MAGVAIDVVAESGCDCNVDEPDTLGEFSQDRVKNHDAGVPHFGLIIDVGHRKKTPRCRLDRPVRRTAALQNTETQGLSVYTAR